MEKAEVVSKLTVLFRQIFKDDSLEISDDLTANDVAQWDSLSHMLLIAEIENLFE